MKRVFPIIPIAFLLLYLNACNSSTGSDSTAIAADSASIAMGQNTFTQNCSACHNFRKDGIGPLLGGLTTQVSAEWIKDFIKNPQSIIESGDERAQELFARYKSVMPSFAHFSDQEINGLLAFINTQKAPSKKERIDPNALENPIPDSIAMSDVVVE